MPALKRWPSDHATAGHTANSGCRRFGVKRTYGFRRKVNPGLNGTFIILHVDITSSFAKLLAGTNERYVREWLGVLIDLPGGNGNCGRGTTQNPGFFEFDNEASLQCPKDVLPRPHPAYCTFSLDS
jgi:hypothetical protein